MRTDSLNFELLTRFAAVKRNSLNFYSLPTSFVLVKTESTKKNYKPPTSFAAVRTDYPNLYKLLTDFLVVKTESTTLQNLATSFTADKNSMNICNPPTCNCNRKKGLHKRLQTFYTHFHSKNGLQELLHAANNFLLQRKRTLRTSAAVKTNFLNLYKPQTGFPLVKTESTNLYRSPTSFAAVKTDYTTHTCF